METTVKQRLIYFIKSKGFLPVTFRPAPGVELCACRSLFAQNLSRFEYFVNKKIIVHLCYMIVTKQVTQYGL